MVFAASFLWLLYKEVISFPSFTFYFLPPLPPLPSPPLPFSFPAPGSMALFPPFSSSSFPSPHILFIKKKTHIYLFIKQLILFYFLAPLYSMQESVSRPETESLLGAWSLNHWITKKAPHLFSLLLASPFHPSFLCPPPFS